MALMQMDPQLDRLREAQAREDKRPRRMNVVSALRYILISDYLLKITKSPDYRDNHPDDPPRLDITSPLNDLLVDSLQSDFALKLEPNRILGPSGWSVYNQQENEQLLAVGGGGQGTGSDLRVIIRRSTGQPNYGFSPPFYTRVDVMVGGYTPQVAEDINYILHDHLHRLERIPMTRVRDLMVTRLVVETQTQMLAEALAEEAQDALDALEVNDLNPLILNDADAVDILIARIELITPPEGQDVPPDVLATLAALQDALDALVDRDKLPEDKEDRKTSIYSNVLDESGTGLGMRVVKRLDEEQMYLYTLLRNSPIDWGMMVYSATRMTGVMDSVFNVPGWPRIQSAYSIMHTETE